jgi:hypothetical protein
MLRRIHKNLLIVCEGTSTEPNYLAGLKDSVRDRLKDYNITIRPKPNIEADDTTNQQSTGPRKGGRIRAMRDVVVEDDEPTIPVEYGAQPIRYIWHAQQGLSDNTYDEAWAVFDRDGHGKHPEAFALARQDIHGKRVHVAFSSVSFETWILMHYEYSEYAFNKSQCRTDKRSHHCGQNIHADDCKGISCITGYLKANKYIEAKVDVKALKYKDLNSRVATAFLHANKLKREMLSRYPDSAIYDLNPVTTIDRLVFKLRNLPELYYWVSIEGMKIMDLPLTVGKVGSVFAFNFMNISNLSIIFLPEFITLLNVEEVHKSIAERKMLQPGESYALAIDLAEHIDFGPIYLSSISAPGQRTILDIEMDHFGVPDPVPE